MLGGNGESGESVKTSIEHMGGKKKANLKVLHLAGLRCIIGAPGGAALALGMARFCL